MNGGAPGYGVYRYTPAQDGPELYARDYGGEGPALLLMHGLTRNSADFEPLAVHLSGRYRLIVPDQRGRGLSQNDPEPGNYRPEVYVQDMFALLDGLGIAEAGLIGTSMGGLMAMVMVAMQPARISAVILNDVGPALESEAIERIASYIGTSELFGSWDEAAARCEAINREAFPDFSWDDWLAFALRTCREPDEGPIVFAYDPLIAEAFENPPDQQPDLWPLWQALSEKPVLVVRGALSDLLTVDTVHQMKNQHSGPFEHCEVPRRGHAPLLDECESLEAIRSFLDCHVN